MILHSHADKNVVSSVESRLEPMGLGDKFCCQRRWCCYATFSFLLQNECCYHNVNAQNVKIARRDRPHILALHRRETFENLLQIDIAPVRRTLSGIYTQKFER